MTYSSFLIVLGVAASCAYTSLLYKKRFGRITPVLALFILGFVLSVFFSRFLHWYSSSTTYESLRQALTDFSVGTFCSSGIVIGACLAGAITGALRICRNKGALMDCAAPGFALLMVFVRLSAWGTGKCQGGKNITAKAFQRFPVTVKGTDAAGNVYYRFATFMIAAVLFALAFLLINRFYSKNCTRKMKEPAKRYGNVWNMMLVLYSAIEIVLDSTRIDSMHFTFRKILTLNRFSTFISIGQIVPFVIFICLFVHYVKCSSKADGGFRFKHIACTVIFAVSAFLIGYLGEYKWQRIGSYRSYLFMTIGSLLIALTIRFLYGQCILKKEE